MLWVDVKYANMLGSYLRNFKRKSEFLWNYSCPVCGDSSKNKLKARGYVYKVKMGLFVKCHNCGYSTNIGNFIKYLDSPLYQEYTLENYKESGLPRSHHSGEDAVPDVIRTSSKPKPTFLSTIHRLDSLPSDHPAMLYVKKRMIPDHCLSLLYIAPKFVKFVNDVVPGKFNVNAKEHPRLVIPFFNEDGECIAFQGRAFGKEDPKYYTIKIDDDAEKIFGLERLDRTKPMYITEGPIDSLFIPNSIAVSGSSFSSKIIETLKDRCTVVYDNEPRSKELTKLIEKTIGQGYKVCLWPDTITQKDINDMIVSGLTSEQVQDIIDRNAVQGIEAQLKFSTWRKC